MTEPRRLDVLVSKAVQRHTPWTEQQEAASWAVVSASLDGRPRRSRTARLALAAAAAVVVVGLAVTVLTSRPPRPELLPATVATTRLSFPGEAMGYAAVDSHAEVVTETASLVRVRQRQGRIEYHVSPDRARAFVVEAADVEVTVLGTAFLVSVDARDVRIEVAHGLVRVKRGANLFLLSDHESVSLSGEAPVDADLTDAVTVKPVGPLDAGASSPPPRPTRPGVEASLERVDGLRSKGRYDEAAAVLRLALRQSPDQARVPAVQFTLGRVEQGRGRHAQAAEAFLRCFSLEPDGSVAEDALAEAAFSFQRAGDDARAIETAKQALAKFPTGVHAARMRDLVP
jgi:transmembrane sensor